MINAYESTNYGYYFIFILSAILFLSAAAYLVFTAKRWNLAMHQITRNKMGRRRETAWGFIVGAILLAAVNLMINSPTTIHWGI
ncbi:hypothetical protein [Escherichia coli]|uniref:hypothetical protein n=1 Tax=Escherichia coli TaxID=562 RepID=UPI000BDF7DCC|nr:hypothetical protein [Escherichia coli]PCS38705.1 hypothetical protein BMR38_25375 [Escherichia coli]PHL32593.1 hypothetical protein BMR39_02230 [Escherichia coli]